MQAGQRIRDYVLEEKIGEGGMGEVWRAQHRILLKRQVAIKAIARYLDTDPEFGERFLQEAQAQAQLNHPSIVGVSDFFEEAGQYFLVMPLLSKKNLAGRLEESQGALPVDEALAVARDVLGALDYAHQQGVIHRDVKPTNILLDAGGRAFLTDFGIALSLGRRRLTQTGKSLGSPYYMSPEQIRSPKNVDHRTDVYSFGCVLYEMLTGRPPFADVAEGDDADFALKEAHVYREPVSPRRRNPQVPAWLDAVVLRALAKKPDERFSGCGEFRRALDAPPPPPPPEPHRVVKRAGAAPPPGKRLPLVLIAAVLTALAFLVLFATRDRWLRREEAEVAEATTADPATAEPLGTDLGTEPATTGPGTAETMASDMGTAEPMGTDTAPPLEPMGDSSSQLSGALSSGQEMSHDFWLEPGYNYSFTGRCTCDNLDLFLDPPGDGAPVDQDAADDTIPVMSYAPAFSGHFTLRISMPGCSEPSCPYTVTVTRAPSGGP